MSDSDHRLRRCFFLSFAFGSRSRLAHADWAEERSVGRVRARACL